VLKNSIEAYKIQIDGLRHDLATTKFQFSQAQAETMASTDQANGHKGRIDDPWHEPATTEAVQMCRSAFARAVFALLRQKEPLRQ
jgi:hypothetical protein